jgi:hypothetical protein
MSGANVERAQADREAQDEALRDVEIRSRCICPGGDIHGPDGEIFTLLARLGFHELALVTKSIRWLKTERPAARPSEVLATLSEAYVRYCLKSWTVTGQPSKQHPKGESIDITPEAVELLLLGPDTADIAQAIADRADDQYAVAVLGPLVRRGFELSAAGPTAGSMSPRNTNGPSRKRSSQSLTGNTRTAGTAATA